MGRLQLFEDEELLLRFRPHVLSYLPHHLGALAWILAGAAGTLTIQLFNPDGTHRVAWGLATLAVVGLVGGFVRARIRKASLAYTWFAILAAMVLITLDVFEASPLGDVAVLAPLGLGAWLALVRMIAWEIDRLQRVHYLTSERLVRRIGAKRREEETVSLKRIQEVRSRLGVLGQLFDYGDLVLVMGRRNVKGESQEDAKILAGIGRLTEAKHHLEQLIEETRLPIRERRKRVDERRLKDSMRRLASWIRRDRTRA